LNGPDALRPPSLALLLAAHGERGGSAGNAGLLRLADALAARGIASEVGVGFVKGTPTVVEALRAFAAKSIVVYPVFASDGYFSRIRLPQLADESGTGTRVSHIFAPLGLDPGLALIVARRLAACARAQGLQEYRTDVILMAHGSRSDPASRLAAQGLAKRLAGNTPFRSVGIALLEEPPSFQQATAGLVGPILVVGLFCGDGMHGAEDVQRQIAQCGRTDIVFAGNIGEFDGIDRLIASAVAQWQAARIT
jgi:sirohydrochlorin ferrochelatase